MSSQGQPRVVIAGAGFGGLWAARALAGAGVNVRLLDRNNYHTFLPLLYQVAAAELDPSLIARPVRGLVRHYANVRFTMTEVQGIDLDAKVVLGAERTYPYDYLILALGSVNHFFDTPGAQTHCFTLKSVAEGIALRNHILKCVEKASQLPPEADEERRNLLTFVIIGGGPTGVEYAGALAELLNHPLAQDYPELDLREQGRVVLVEAGAQLIAGIGGGDYAYRRLSEMAVDIRLNSPVSEVTDRAVILAAGAAIATASPVWTAGVRGAQLAEDLPLTRVRGGRIPVRPTLQTLEHDDVFVIGDLACLEQDGQMLPGVAQVAMQQGAHAAHNVVRLAQQAPAQPFRYRDKGAMATIGRNAAVARLGGRLHTGFIAWLIWLVIHIFFLIGFRNRLGVLLNWAWNYVFFERTVRLILPLTRGPR